MDKQNRAGYSPIMLTALATLKTQDDIETVLQLFRLGDVNAKASQVRAPGAADLGSPSHVLRPGYVPSRDMISFQGRVPTPQNRKLKLGEADHFLKFKLEGADLNSGCLTLEPLSYDLSRLPQLQDLLVETEWVGGGGEHRGPQPFLT